MSRRMWEAVKAKTEEVGMVEAKGRRSQRESREKMEEVGKK